MDKWFKLAERLPAPTLKNNIAHNNGNRKMVVHFTEGHHGRGQAKSIAEYVIREQKNYSIVVDFTVGEFVQIVPADGGARSLLNGGIYQGIGCNRSGAICIQMAICGKTADAEGLMRKARSNGLDQLVQWADSWGIPRVDLSPESGRRPTAWNRSGWTDHYSAPGNDHTDGLRNKGFLGTIPFDSERDVAKYVMTVSRNGKSYRVLNRDGVPATYANGWTLDKAHATEFPHGHIRDENVHNAAEWANRQGFRIIDTALL